MARTQDGRVHRGRASFTLCCVGDSALWARRSHRRGGEGSAAEKAGSAMASALASHPSALTSMVGQVQQPSTVLCLTLARGMHLSSANSPPQTPQACPPKVPALRR